MRRRLAAAQSKECIMSSFKAIAWSPAAPPETGFVSSRRALSAALRRASALLAPLARRIGKGAARGPAGDPQRLEFYAEAGAPEGALYLDGQLIGWMRGVR